MSLKSAKTPAIAVGYKQTKETRAAGNSPIAGFTVLAKTMIGSGILGLAGSCGSAGLVVGVGTLLFGAFITWLTLVQLSYLGLHFVGEVKPLSFYVVAQKIAPRLAWVVDVAVIVLCWGTLIAYLQVAGDMLSSLILENTSSIGVSEWWLRALVQIGVCTLLSPFYLCKEVTRTEIPNMIGLTGLMFITVVACIYANPGEIGDQSLDPSYVSLWPADGMKALSGLSVFLFAFACQQNLFPTLEELTPASLNQRTLAKMTGGAVSLGMLIMAPAMLLPYLTYGGTTSSNFLDNLDLQHWPVQAAYVFAFLSVSISFPLQVHPLRRSLIALFRRGKDFHSPKSELLCRVGLSLGTVLPALVVAMFCRDLGVVMNLSGLLGANTVCFVMPTWLFIKFYWRRGEDGSPKEEEARPPKVMMCASWVVLAVMLAFYPLALFSIVWDETHKL